LEERPGVSKTASNPTGPDDDFQHALKLYRRGERTGAENICQNVLRRQPAHFGALHLLGLIELGIGHAERAADLIGQAIALNPTSADAHNNRGAALRELGRPHEALSSYTQAIMLKPDSADAYFNRAAVWRDLGRAAEAVADYDRAIELKPGNAAAHFNRGNARRDLGNREAALEDYDRAIALKPDFAEAFNNRAKIERDLGRFGDALASYNAAIGLRPDFAESHNNRASVLRNLERPEEALVSCETAITLNPSFAEAYVTRGSALLDLQRPLDALASFDNAILRSPEIAEAFNNRGNALAELGRHEEALWAYDKALAFKPNYPDAHNNRGAVLISLARQEDALSGFNLAIALDPDHADAHNNRGNVSRDLGRHDEAMSSFDRALALNPDFAAARWNRSLCELAMGDYESGWKNFEWRWKSELSRAKRDFPGPVWRGDFAIENRTILVHAEQGLGDSLQFCRYIPLLARRARVFLEVPRPLVRLLATLDGVAGVIATGDTPPGFDAWTPMLSLPMAFGTNLGTVPNSVPYLYAGPEQSATWRERLATLPGRKVGLVWAGSPRPENPRANAVDRRRSISLGHYEPLAAIPDLCLISLQKGEPGSQAMNPPAGMMLHDWTGELDDFADSAALVDALDLVISVDTSVAHLAGALGKPVWVLNRFDQCWRWLRDRADSPWYPTARLFRQSRAGDWGEVIRDVVAALRAGE